MSEEQQPSLLKRLHGNPTVQAILFIFALIYIISPVDLISGDLFTFGPGMLDDLAVLITEIAQFIVYMNRKKTSFNNLVQNTSFKVNQSKNKEENK